VVPGERAPGADQEICLPARGRDGKGGGGGGDQQLQDSHVHPPQVGIIECFRTRKGGKLTPGGI
jgi:hypothetical protein